MIDRGPATLLLHDGTLSLTCTPDARPLIAGWMPIGLRQDPAPAGAEISVRVGVVAPMRVPSSTLRLLAAKAWIEGDVAHLHHPSGAGGGVDLRTGRADIALVADAADAVEPILTLAAALLIGRLGRALVHSAAVVAPSGRAWLLVGDSHAGKSSTVATLALAGWGYLSDDQVVLSQPAGQVVVEGWCRPFNLDVGWERGESVGRREPRPVLQSGQNSGQHGLAGMLLPHVTPESPTALTPATSADGFEALVRQSPWLLADRSVAPSVVALLTSAARLAVRHLSLGRDSYHRPDRLIEVLTVLGT